MNNKGINIGTVILSNSTYEFVYTVDIDNFLNDNLDTCLDQTEYDDYQLYVEAEEIREEIFNCNITEKAFLELFSVIKKYEIYDEEENC